MPIGKVCQQTSEKIMTFVLRFTIVFVGLAFATILAIAIIGLVFELFSPSSPTIDSCSDQNTACAEQSDFDSGAIYNSIDNYLRDSLLSLDVCEQAKDHSNKYNVLFSYDRDIEKSKLVLVDSVDHATTVEEFTDNMHTLTTNYSLPAYEYKDYLVFSIDPKIFGCSKDDGEWCHEYIDEIREDSIHAGIYRLNLNGGELTKLLNYDGHEDPQRLFYPVKDTAYILMVIDEGDSTTTELLNIENAEVEQLRELEKTVE